MKKDAITQVLYKGRLHDWSVRKKRQHSFSQIHRTDCKSLINALAVCVYLTTMLRTTMLRTRMTGLCTSLGMSVRSFASSSYGTEFVQSTSTENDHITVLTMARAKAKNALGNQMMSEFTGALTRLQHCKTTRCVILRSSVDGVFCAGADLKERKEMTQHEAGIFVSGLRGAFTALENLPVPVIAVIEGAALGGGLEVALAADIRISGERGLFGLPETGLGIIPGAGGTQRLPRLIGAQGAKELMFTGRRIGGEEAKEYGIVSYCVEDPYAKAIELAEQICEKGPIGVKQAKIAVNSGMQTDITTGMEIERQCDAQTLTTKDRIEGLNAFREKRKPVYIGE